MTAAPGEAESGRSVESHQSVRSADAQAASSSTLQPILVPLDGSDLAERALPFAEMLAAPGCQLILLEVGQDEEEFHLMDRHEGACAQLETSIGDPAQQILQVARELGVGLIVMTTHGRGAIGRWAFGSVADKISRMSPVPVMVIRPEEGDAQPDPVIRRVVVPLDGSPLAAQALPTAAAIAKQMQAPVYLVSAIDLSRLLPVELMPTVAFSGELYEEAVTQAQDDASQWLTQAALDLQHAGLDVSQEVKIGSPSTVIRDVSQPGDVIVLASRGHGGATRVVLGSVAEQLVREAPVPVVLVPASAQVKSNVSDHAVPTLREA